MENKLINRTLYYFHILLETILGRLLLVLTLCSQSLHPLVSVAITNVFAKFHVYRTIFRAKASAFFVAAEQFRNCLTAAFCESAYSRPPLEVVFLALVRR